MNVIAYLVELNNSTIQCHSTFKTPHRKTFSVSQKTKSNTHSKTLLNMKTFTHTLHKLVCV